LKLPYTVLMDQPDWWVESMQALISGRNQAENLANKPSGKNV
jgi:hypothetical protein